MPLHLECLAQDSCHLRVTGRSLVFVHGLTRLPKSSPTRELGFFAFYSAKQSWLISSPGHTGPHPLGYRQSNAQGQQKSWVSQAEQPSVSESRFQDNQQMAQHLLAQFTRTCQPYQRVLATGQSWWDRPKLITPPEKVTDVSASGSCPPINRCQDMKN